jgi:hypothetical protein
MAPLSRWSLHRRVALGYAVILALVAALNYLPGIPRPEGRVFGIFALDPYDDALHLASSLWALVAALLSARAARVFLLLFGVAYLSDGLLGVVTGVGWLDLAIVTIGPQDYGLLFNVLASAPHIVLGGVALLAGLRGARA